MQRAGTPFESHPWHIVVGGTLAVPSFFTFGNVLEGLLAFSPFLSFNQHLVSVDDVDAFGGRENAATLQVIGLLACLLI